MKPPIVVLGPGRCGSTLVQRILNTSDKITIWGEHAGFLSPLAESYFYLTKSQGIQNNYYSRPLDSSVVVGSLSDYTVDISWINSFDRQLIINKHRQLLKGILNDKVNLNLDEIHWGFKEIRYTKQDRAIDMWLELFPQSSLIFSVRDPFQVIKSMLLSWNNPEEIKNYVQSKQIQKAVPMALGYAQRWNSVVSSFKYWKEDKGIHCCIEKYEDTVADPEHSVEKLFKFLNVEVPETALGPMKYKAGKAPGSSAEPEVRQLVYYAQKQIWEIVGNAAEYFGYSLSNVEALRKK